MPSLQSQVAQEDREPPPGLLTQLKPHQQRVIDKLKASGGLLVAHGLGSGKTLSAIAAAQAMGLPTEAVVPAALVANYEKELRKHTGGIPQGTRIRSYEKAVREGTLNPQALVVLDEAHRARNLDTDLAKIVGRQAGRAQARLLLTGTPNYNQPSDIASLLNVAAGRPILPSDPAMFKRVFIGEKEVKPSLLARIGGAKPVMVPYLRNPEMLTRAATGYVDVHAGGGEGFPRRKDEEFHVPMSSEQHRVYRYHEGTMPWYLRAKVRSGLPMTKQESQQLNAFQGALRQTSNTPRPYVEGMTDVEEAQHTPKLNLMAQHLQEKMQQDPNFRGVAYSNYLEGGLLPLSQRLTEMGIPHNVFHGGVSAPERARMVQEYNTGQTPVLLVSSSGTEGLDLKGTKMIQVMEPHWNESRINQVIGRGIRYQSHEHLPENEREVSVRRYHSALPKPLMTRMGFSKPPKSIEQYIRVTADTKNKIFSQINEALQRASDAGPLKKQSTVTPEMLAREIYGLSEHPKRRQHFLYEDPSGLRMELPYDPEHLMQRARAGGQSPDDYVRQLGGAVQTAAMSSVGDVDRMNKKLRRQAGGEAAGKGALLGLLAGSLGGGLAAWKWAPELWEPFTYLGVTGGTGLGGYLGHRLGTALYRDKSPRDVVSTVQLPELVPPKEVKSRPKLTLKGS